jgi:hypothetical protein
LGQLFLALFLLYFYRYTLLYFYRYTLAIVALILWRHIFITLNTDHRDQLWLIAALAFSSPLFWVTFQSNSVWFFAQSIGFFTMTLALWAAICVRSLVLVTTFLGCAFLCRQMSIFWLPALFVLTIPIRELWWPPSRRALLSSVAAVAVFTSFVAIYCFYNIARFGAPLETGYSMMVNTGDALLMSRVSEVGLFSQSYFLQNLLYLFVQGIHVDFGGQYLTQVQGFDMFGASLLTASPWIILAVYLLCI